MCDFCEFPLPAYLKDRFNEERVQGDLRGPGRPTHNLLRIQAGAAAALASLLLFLKGFNAVLKILDCLLWTARSSYFESLAALFVI